jgi:arsenate reductase (glutaredoxin)
MLGTVVPGPRRPHIVLLQVVMTTIRNRPTRSPEYHRSMADLRLLHNPKCSKSREALALLTDRGADPEVVLYLDEPPDRATLELVVRQLDDPGRLVRKDPHFKELGLVAGDYTTPEAVVDLLVEHPRLMERPVAIRGDRAVLGRPPEDILTLLDD